MLAVMVAQVLTRSAADATLPRVALAYALALVVALAAGWALHDQHPIFVAAAADLVATLVVFSFSVGRPTPAVSILLERGPAAICRYWAAVGAGTLRQLF